MKIKLIAARAASVARDAAIVAREKIRTTDAQRIRTTDPAASQFSWKGRGRFRDTVLSAETTPRNPNIVDRAWSSNIKAELASLSATDRAKALDAMRRVLDDYAIEQGGFSSGSLRPGNAGSLGTGAADERPEQEFNVGSTATPDDLNAANRQYWDRANKRTHDAPPHDATAAAIQGINDANRQYWQRQTAHQANPRREWGKG